MPTILLNLRNNSMQVKNIQDRIGVVRRKFGRFQVKLPLSVVSVGIVRIYALIRQVWGIS